MISDFLDQSYVLAQARAQRDWLQDLIAKVRAKKPEALAALIKHDVTAKQIETAIAALAGKQPDAALQQRIQRYQTSRQQGEAELAQKENQIQSTQANVQRQIGARVVQLSEAARARRQADIVIGKSATLASNGANDITAEVLAALNQQLPSVSVTPLPQQAAPAGR